MLLVECFDAVKGVCVSCCNGLTHVNLRNVTLIVSFGGFRMRPLKLTPHKIPEAPLKRDLAVMSYSKAVNHTERLSAFKEHRMPCFTGYRGYARDVALWCLCWCVTSPDSNQPCAFTIIKTYEEHLCFRRQQRPPGGGGGGGVKSQNPQQQGPQQPPNQTQQPSADHQSGVGTKHGGWGYQGQQNQGGRQGGPHHGYSQNRRWHQYPKHQTNNFSQGPSGADRTPTCNAKETENVKRDEPEPHIERAVKDEPVREQKLKNENDGKTEAGKICLLQSSKERLRKRLKEKVCVHINVKWHHYVITIQSLWLVFSDWQEDVPVATAGPQQNRMDRLLEILNSMRNNRSGVEAQLTAFMEEAQSSADSEETLNEIVHTIYHKAVSNRSFAATAAKLCDKMALFMVEGTKFRSLLLNMLQVRSMHPDLRFVKCFRVSSHSDAHFTEWNSG